MVVAIAKLAPGSSFTSSILHLEREEVFGFVKRKQNMPLGLKGDSHKHDHVNFSCLWVDFISCNSAPNGDIGQPNRSQEGFPVLIHNGEEVLECLCGDNV